MDAAEGDGARPDGGAAKAKGRLRVLLEASWAWAKVVALSLVNVSLWAAIVAGVLIAVGVVLLPFLLVPLLLLLLVL
ncbi:MAG: hypothetical protein LBL86_07195 [Coriobacteriales bacterium]|jgi:hypothetical protein|nr:hypothetical protein [Coriobacteriales bacterium]